MRNNTNSFSDGNRSAKRVLGVGSRAGDGRADRRQRDFAGYERCGCICG